MTFESRLDKFIEDYLVKQRFSQKIQRFFAEELEKTGFIDCYGIKLISTNILTSLIEAMRVSCTRRIYKRWRQQHNDPTHI